MLLAIRQPLGTLAPSQRDARTDDAALNDGPSTYVRIVGYVGLPQDHTKADDGGMHGSVGGDDSMQANKSVVADLAHPAGSGVYI